MADELHGDVERELQRFKPTAMPESLQGRLRQEPRVEEEPLTFADRALVTISSMGAIAAGVIVLVIVIQLAAPAGERASASEIAAHQKMTLEYQRMLASH